MQSVHRHPLSLDSICCPDHVFELCSYFQKHSRDEEVIFALLSLSEMLEAGYLGDLTAQTQSRKRALIALANEFSLYCGNSDSLDVAANLLSVAETLLSGLQPDEEAEGLHITTLLNLAFLCCKEGNLPKALEALEEADKSDQKRKDPISHATVKISLSSVLIQMENYEEGHAQAQAAFRLLEEEQQRSHDFVSQKLRGLMLAAKLSLTSASERLYEGKPSNQLYELKTSLIECVEAKPQEKMREYDGSPIQAITRRSGRKVTAASTMAEDFRSFCERVQGWEGEKPIENPSFFKEERDTPKTGSRLLSVRSPKSEKVKPLPRMPNTALPQIPTRSSAFKHTYINFFRTTQVPTDYRKLLLNCLTDRSECVRIQRIVDETVFVIQLTVSKGQFTFSASSSQVPNPPEEALSAEEVGQLMSVLYLEEVSPKYVRAGLVLSLADFAQFCLFPFLQIAAPGKKASKRLEFWSYAPGLLPNASSRLFLGKKRRLVAYQLSEFTLRIVLCEVCNSPKSENSISFEVQLDTDIKNKFGMEKDSSGELRELKQEFLQMLEPAFEEMAKMMKTGKQFLLVRVLVASDSPSLLLHFLSDHPASRCLRIHTVTTLTPNSNDPTLLPYSLLLSKFGLLPSHMPPQTIDLVSGFILDSILVEQIIDSNEKLIRLAPIVEISGCRTILSLGDQMIPVTLVLIGVKARIIGVRAVAWDVKKSLESGVLWYLDSRNYRTTLEASSSSQARKKKKLEKADRLSEMAEKETSLITLLEDRMGWKTLVQALTLGPGPSPRLQILSPTGEFLSLARLEAYIRPI
jgi:tetratricopeptide (TPR) repeat protein